MQNGPYIAERLMPQIVTAYCRQNGIEIQAFSDEWVLRLTKDGVHRWIVGYKFDLNRSAAGELAQDKVAAYSALAAANIDAVPHYLVRSLPHELIHTQDLHEQLYGLSVVAKPLDGTSGRDVMRFASLEQALDMIRMSGEPAWAVSPHHELQAEYRLVMLGDEPQLVYEKTQPTYRDDLKLFNLSYGAVAIDVTDEALKDQLTTIARRVMQATGLTLAAVDIVRLTNGDLWIMEVNDGISMEHYARQSAEHKDRARAVYDAIAGALFV